MNSKLLTLQDFCFNFIMKEFTKYSSAYLTATNNELRKSLHFLQRTRTQEIYAGLLKKRRLEKQHLDFLLNDYLKVVNISDLVKLLKIEEVIEKVSKIGHSLLELSYVENVDYFIADYSYTFEALVPYIPNVTKIRIWHICNDDLLKMIAHSCPQLSELDIYSSTGVTGVGISELCLSQNNCRLKVINIDQTHLRSNDIANLLKCMPTLQEVKYDDLPEVLYFIHKKDIDNNTLENKYNLIHLDFIGKYYHYLSDFMNPDEYSLKLVSQLSMCSQICPFVKKIVVPVKKIDELKVLCQFLELEDVSIRGDRCSIVELNDFVLVRGEKLKNLYVRSCTLSISTLITCCFNLEVLELDDIQYQKPNDDISKYLSKLKSFKVNALGLNDSFGIKSIVLLLNFSPILENVSFFNSDVDSEIIDKLSLFPTNCKMKNLSFVDTYIEIDHLQQIVSNCDALKTLYIESCNDYEEVNMLRHTIAVCNKSIDLNIYTRQYVASEPMVLF